MDEEGITEIDVTLPLAEHTPGDVEIVEATTLESGSETVSCTECGEVLSYKEIPAKIVSSIFSPITGEKGKLYMVVLLTVVLAGGVLTVCCLRIGKIRKAK